MAQSDIKVQRAVMALIRGKAPWKSMSNFLGNDQAINLETIENDKAPDFLARSYPQPVKCFRCLLFSAGLGAMTSDLRGCITEMLYL